MEYKRVKKNFVNHNVPIQFWKRIAKFCRRRQSQTGTENVDGVGVFLLGPNEQEEKCQNDIVKRNVQVNELQQLNLHIYYKNCNIRQIFIINKPHANPEDSRVVYQYICTKKRCQPLQKYIGYWMTIVKQIMTTHAQNGSIVYLSLQEHGIRIRTAGNMTDIKIL